MISGRTGLDGNRVDKGDVILLIGDEGETRAVEFEHLRFGPDNLERDRHRIEACRACGRERPERLGAGRNHNGQRGRVIAAIASGTAVGSPRQVEGQLVVARS